MPSGLLRGNLREGKSRKSQTWRSMAAKTAGWAASLKSVSVAFSPAASAPKHVAAVRELLRQLRTPRAGASDKLATNVQLAMSGDVEVKFHFASGKMISVPPEGLKMRELRAVIEAHT